MAQESSLHSTGGLSLWHRKAVSIAQEGCRYGTEGQAHGTGRLSLWHMRTVPMTQEGCPHDTGGLSP